MGVWRGRSTRTIIRFSLFSLLLAVLVMGSGCGEAKPAQADAAQLQQYFERYVSLVNSGDAEGLREHLGNPAQPHDASDRIAAYADLGLHDVHIRVRESSVAPDVLGVTVMATDRSGETVEMKETVVWEQALGAQAEEGRWVLGPLKAIEWRLEGTWRDESGEVMKAAVVSREDDVIAVDYAPFGPSKVEFVADRFDPQQSPGSYRRVIYVPGSGEGDVGVITYDFVSDSIEVLLPGRGDVRQLIRTRTTE